MTKKTYMIIVGVVLILIIGFMWWNSTRVEQEPTLQNGAQSVDTTEAIQQELDGIAIGDVDAEFKDVDEELRGL